MIQFKHKLLLLFNRIFTFNIMCKVLIIFTVGLISRIFVNAYYDINVFADFLHPVSVAYYFVMSVFITMLHEFANFNCLPTFSLLFSNLNSFIFNNFSMGKLFSIT